MLQRFALALSAAVVLTVGCSQSDPGVTTAVKSKLAADDTVKAYQIDVDTNDRVVTLSGSVETAAEKEHAMMLARQTDGVEDVIDRITVDPTAATTGEIREEADETAREAREEANEAAREGREEGREAGQDARELGREAERKAGEAAGRTSAVVTDAAITSAVKAKFLADIAVSGLEIDVDTNGGVVTLNGNVGTKAEADRAVSLARETNGVTRVVNSLKIGG